MFEMSTAPWRDGPVDELRAGLELATEDELAVLTDLMFRRRLNPLDYLCSPEPIEVQSQRYDDWITSLEDRFRFLAADGVTVLKGQAQSVTYRQALIQLCRFLKIAHTPDWSTLDLESEIFLHLLLRSWKRLPSQEKNALSNNVKNSLNTAQLTPHLPPALRRDPLRLLLKGSSALAVSSVLRPWLLKQIARQFALHAATHQAARQTLVRGGAAVAVKVQSQVAAQMAARGMAVQTARYSAVRSIMAFLGPALWAYFFADLGWRTISVNYGRILPVVFILAQIRLTRSAESADFDAWMTVAE